MLSQHIALVPEAGGVNASELSRVCAALQKQLTRDLLPIWGITATIDAFPSLEDVPLGYWPIIITFCELGDQAGVHIDRNGQPYAQVEMSPGWSLQASQACLDMLVNPFGRRLVAGPSPRPDQGPVEFLLEICAPCSGADCGYVIDDVLVSDFCTPAYWGSLMTAQNSFSFAGTLQAPHQVMEGGHLTWHDPIGDKWWLRHHMSQTLVDTKLGSLDGRTGVVRESMRLRAPEAMRVEKMTIEAFESRLGVRRQHGLRASQFHAHRLRTAVASDAPPALTRDAELLDPKLVRSNERMSVAKLVAKGAHRDYAPRTVESRAVDDDVESEVTQSELIEAERREAPAPSMPPPRTVPPPLPDEAVRASRAPAAHSVEAAPKPAEAPGTHADPTMLSLGAQAAAAQAAPVPRATPLPPPRMPDRTYPPPTLPPVSMAPANSLQRQTVNAWLLVAAVVAAAGVGIMAATLLTRAPSADATSHVSNAAGPANNTAAGTQAAMPIAVPTTPAAPSPTVAVPPPPTATPPQTAQQLNVAAAPVAVAATTAAAAAPAPVPAAPPAPTTTVARDAVPAAQTTPRVAARPKAPGQPTPAPARRPPPTPAPSDDSDPLEGLIGERR